MRRLGLNLTRWLTGAAVLLGVTVAAPLATAPSAAAASGCSGSVIDSQEHYSYSGAHVATSYLYWDGTNNCVIAYKAGSYYGINSRMSLTLMADSGGQASDSGSFAYYAGPVSLNGVGRCVAYELDMWSTSGADMMQDRLPPGGYFHCG